MDDSAFLEKKGFLDYLYYSVGGQQFDFFLQYSDKEKDIHSKWRKYSEVCFDFEDWKNRKFIEQANHRQILGNEVVLDLEEKESLPKITKTLDEWGYPYYVYETGSRGFHIHLFLKKKLNEAQKLSIIEYFGTDKQKCHEKTLIALENTPHWKSGKLKKQVGGYGI